MEFEKSTFGQFVDRIQYPLDVANFFCKTLKKLKYR